MRLTIEREKLGWISGFVFLMLILSVSFGLSVIFGAGPASKELLTTPADAAVKIQVGEGHGSGVYLGNHVILTAAHVVKDKTEITALWQNGGQSEAHVLWVSEKRDVALLRATAQPSVSSADLACAGASPGAKIYTLGSPMRLAFVLAKGHVMGPPQSVEGAEPETLQAIDLPVAPGNSGSPVFDTGGRVVGIVNSMMFMPLGFSVSATGINFMVPSTVICPLLARS